MSDVWADVAPGARHQDVPRPPPPSPAMPQVSHTLPGSQGEMFPIQMISHDPAQAGDDIADIINFVSLKVSGSLLYSIRSIIPMTDRRFLEINYVSFF